MSKASEYSKEVNKPYPEPIEFVHISTLGNYVAAKVDMYGGLTLRGANLSKEEVLALRDWITENFEERVPDSE